MKHWTLDDIPWDRFDASRVDPQILRVVKAASMVESNGGDYAIYLCNVFGDDPEFQQVALAWADEEVQHGAALARWAALADPGFDFADSFKRFTDGYRLPIGARRSVRGSRSGELVARCVVETGTSSFYSALKEATDEPVLKLICQRIAADEFRHYKLFYEHLNRYRALERVGRWRRLRVALGRAMESEDDELAYAYYAANDPTGRYDRGRHGRAYIRRAYPLYRRHHVDRIVAMTLKAAGFGPPGRIAAGLAALAYRFMRRRADRLARAGA